MPIISGKLRQENYELKGNPGYNNKIELKKRSLITSPHPSHFIFLDKVILILNCIFKNMKQCYFLEVFKSLLEFLIAALL